MTCPGDLTLRDLRSKLSQKLQNSWGIRQVKTGRRSALRFFYPRKTAVGACDWHIPAGRRLIIELWAKYNRLGKHKKCPLSIHPEPIQGAARHSTQHSNSLNKTHIKHTRSFKIEVTYQRSKYPNRVFQFKEHGPLISWNSQDEPNLSPNTHKCHMRVLDTKH